MTLVITAISLMGLQVRHGVLLVTELRNKFLSLTDIKRCSLEELQLIQFQDLNRE